MQLKHVKWVGHFLRMETSQSAREKKKGRPETTWRRSVEAELKDMGITWGEAESLAKDKTAWRLKVAVFSGWRVSK